MMRTRHIAFAVLLFPALSCRVEAPFERSNPLDPGSVYEFSLAGPDSTHSRGEEFQLALSAEPSLPSGTYYMRWLVETWVDETTREQRDIVDPLGGGRYVASMATARYRKIWFRLELDETPVGFQAWVGQKAVSMTPSCAPFACTSVAAAPEAIIPVRLTLADPSGSALREVQWAVLRAELTSRDPAVVSPLPVTSDVNGIVRLRAVAPGATWVVIRVDDAVDSVRVAVAP